MKRAIFPGTFDPFTIGHYDIVLRGLAIFDEIVIGIGINQTKQTFFTLEKRLEMIRQSFQNEPRVSVKAYDDLTIHFAEQEKAAFILRGVRSVNDFEYERTIADANKQLNGVETVILNTNPAYSFVSSTVVRDLLLYKKDITAFLPPNVIL